MGGSKAEKSKDPCPTCGNLAYEIWWKGNHGESNLLEIHCNRCGWAIDGETGEIRNPGRVSEQIERSNLGIERQ